MAGLRRFEHQHIPAATGQRPGGGQTEKARPHHDALPVLGHGAILGTDPAPEGVRGPAVRSPGVKSPGQLPTRGVARARLSHAVRIACRHALWIVLFSLPAIALWWHVWTGHPSSTLTCPCGDPAQEVWFIAWPAYALAHAANPFFSGAVNVPFGANLLSNTSGTLVGAVLSPVTWLSGPVTSTNVALTLAPGLSAWGCWLAIRRFVDWKPGAIPAALVYGYSSAIVTALIFGHVSVTVLVIPPLLFAALYEIVVRQGRPAWRDGLALCALVVTQFLISPEVLVMCALLALIGLVIVVLVGRRSVASHLPHALRALRIGLGLSVVLLAYPAWFGLAGPQAVTGVLFTIAPIAGVYVTGYLSPGAYGSFADSYVRFGGYFGRIGPPPNYLGWGAALSAAGSAFLARRRPLVWLLVALAAGTAWLSLGSYFLGSPRGLAHLWLPWRDLSRLPLFKEILPDQFAPLLPFFVALLLALGLDVAHRHITEFEPAVPGREARVKVVSGLVTVAVGLVATVPVFITFDLPMTVQSTAIPYFMAHEATRLPPRTVLLTVPFPISGSTAPMLWQAVDGMRFDLAGAGLKTPNASGGPLGQGSPGTAPRILADLTLLGHGLPKGTPAQLAAVRRAVRTWGVNEVVIDGTSRDPVYASGFLTAALGAGPAVVHQAWVWRIPPGGPRTPEITGALLPACRYESGSTSASNDPLAMARCVLLARGVGAPAA
jgi:hypothetical protein